MAVKFKSFVSTPEGIKPISIEVEILQGMPDFKVIGLSDRSIREVHDRARAAIKNNNFKFPIHRKIINLIPAHLPKQGTHLDLPIILGLLIKSGQIVYSPKPDTLFLGEVTLTGDIRPVPNISSIIEAAKNDGIKNAFIPFENRDDIINKDINIIKVGNLKELVQNLYEPKITKVVEQKFVPLYPTFDDIINQQEAKRAITLTIAGQHKLLLIGPPGCGKSLLAQSARNLLPNIPLVSINGDITLSKFKTEKYDQAKNGLLIFNELNELNKDMLDSMKIILEDSPRHSIISTINPCKCGYNQDPYKICFCTSYNLKLYKQKITGPLLDRFDMALRIVAEPLVDKPTNNLDETKKAIEIISQSRNLQQVANNSVPLKILLSKMDPQAKNLVKVIEKKYAISNRRLQKLIQVALTISQTNGTELINENHIAESFKYQKFLIQNDWTKFA